MRRLSFFLVVILAAAALAAAHAQGQKPPAGPAQGQKPPAGAPAEQAPPDPRKPYKQVAVTPPTQVSDPTFAAFRAKLGDAAKKKDRAALGKLVVNPGF